MSGVLKRAPQYRETENALLAPALLWCKLFFVRLLVVIPLNTATWSKKRQKAPGVFDGVAQHVADKFEQQLNMYNWGMPVGQTAGRLFKVSPTELSSTTFTHKAVGPFK